MIPTGSVTKSTILGQTLLFKSVTAAGPAYLLMQSYHFALPYCSEDVL